MNLLIDIGATNTKIGISKNLKKLCYLEIIKTPKKYKKLLNFLCKFKNIKASCVGIPGILDFKKEKILKAPNLKDYENKNFKKDLKNILNCNVILENDSALCGLGEAVYGAGKKFKILAYITLSTGIGGVRIVNKKIDKNYFGFEPGHSIIKIENKFYEFEEIFSGLSIKKNYKKEAKNINNKKFWRKFLKIISIFLINVSLFWSPEAIILGGGLTKSISFINLKKEFYKNFKYPIKPKLLISKLKNLNGIYGAMYLLKNNL